MAAIKSHQSCHKAEVVTHPLSYWLKKQLRPANIGLSCAVWMCTIRIFSRVSWPCRCHGYLSPLAQLVWDVNITLFSQRELDRKTRCKNVKKLKLFVASVWSEPSQQVSLSLGQVTYVVEVKQVLKQVWNSKLPIFVNDETLLYHTNYSQPSNNIMHLCCVKTVVTWAVACLNSGTNIKPLTFVLSWH